MRSVFLEIGPALVCQRGPFQDLHQDCIDLAACVFQWNAGIHNEVGFGALFVVRQLPRDQRVEFVNGHAGSRQEAGTLDVGRGAHNNNGVEKSMRRGLEEKRYFEDSQVGAFVLFVEQKAPFGSSDTGVDDGFELLQFGRRGDDLHG